MGTTAHNDRRFDVRKDRLDLRDRIYQPILRSLPHNYPKFDDIGVIISSYQKAGLILNQGENGACTGYALASTINYLLWRNAVLYNYKSCVTNPKKTEVKKVSAQMLYNLARIYDEWDGEDYEGSSCRGAMKGWHKHGVCEESCWEFEQTPQNDWEKEAIEHPLGAYYRVEKFSIVDMQSALCEVGALYASAAIHEGWWELKNFENTPIDDPAKDIPYIPYEEFSVGNHAFVIVGYTRYGFIIQNSWGSEWGNGGFAILSYKDWLEHGMDVWVAVMGVPVDVETVPNTFTAQSLANQTVQTVEDTKIMERALDYEYRKNELEPITEEQAYNHTLVLNSYGRAKHTIIRTLSAEESIRVICFDNVKKWLDNRENNKVALYALGGFYDEKEYISKIRVMAPYFLKNGIYPIFLTWQNSFYRAVYHAIKDFYEGMLQEHVHSIKPKDILKKREALNRAIENHCRKISTRAIWSEIKEKALNANKEEIEVFNNKPGALFMLTKAFQELQQTHNQPFEIHAIGHSAGSQLIATEWLVQLADSGLSVQSTHLIAPTLTVRDAFESMEYAQLQDLFQLDQVHIYMLSQELEEEDYVSKYDMSLLILISRALEKIHKTPLLGLEEAWKPKNAEFGNDMFNQQHHDDVLKWHNFAEKCERKCHKHIYRRGDTIKSSKRGDSVRLSHRNLDRSIEILDKALRIIVHNDPKEKLMYPVENLS